MCRAVDWWCDAAMTTRARVSLTKKTERSGVPAIARSVPSIGPGSQQVAVFLSHPSVSFRSLGDKEDCWMRDDG